MKLIAALALSMLVGGVANAHQKSTKKLVTIVKDRAGNVYNDVVEYPAEIGQFAIDSGCSATSKDVRCGYRMPAGLFKYGMITVADMGSEVVMTITEVPGRMLDAVTTSFEACAANTAYKADKAVCKAFAWTFDKAGHLVYGAGYYVAGTVSNVGRSAGETVQFSIDAVDSLSQGKVGAAALDLLHGFVAMPLCVLGNTVATAIETLITGKNVYYDCASSVRDNRKKSGGNKAGALVGGKR